MSKLSRAGIIISFILAVLITVLFLINFCVNQILIKTEIDQEIMQIESNSVIPVIDTKEENIVWQIKIPQISLIGDIAEGTSKEILNQYIGHFETTPKTFGNIGLAAHNRGYSVNFFQNIKQLKQGDEIQYKYKDFEKIYVVKKNRIIKDTDWEYLDNTEENMLTLITCVENQPEFRRCVQAVEKEEEIE